MHSVQSSQARTHSGPSDRLCAPIDLRGSSPQAKLTGNIRLCGRDREIFGEGELALSYFEVIAGTVRTYRLLADGRRQIDAFHLRGDVFGIQDGQEHRLCAEAVDDVTLRVIVRRSPDLPASGDPSLVVRLFAAMSTSLRRAQDHMVLLGRKSAREKLATFFLDLAERLATGAVVEVAMSRTDMADHLGLTIETVSRTLTQFQRDDLIELCSSRVVRLTDKAALRRLADGEAGAGIGCSIPFRTSAGVVPLHAN
jgi:CRP/FNR family nitrogen fixation transcriptional regulator